MTRTVAGVIAAVVLLAGVVGAGLGPAVGQSGGTETTVDCTYPIEVTDASGTTVTVDEEPEDVVVLAPSAAQVLWGIGAQEKVVGMPVNQYTAYLDGSSERTNVVGEQGQPQVETIIGLEPDLVLAPNITSEDAVDQLKQADITVAHFEQAASVDDVVEKTRLTGRLVGEYDAARNVSAQTEATVEAYRSATADAERPTVYYALGFGYTAGPETFIGDVIDAAGGDNIAGSANISGYKPISKEVVVEQNPDWIVVPTGIDVPSGSGLNETTAIKEDQIVRVDRNFMSQPGPRVTQPLNTLATTFHPDATADVTVDTAAASSPICEGNAVTPTVTPTATQTVEETTVAGSETTETADGTTVEATEATMTGPAVDADTTVESGGETGATTTGGPGFGAVAALVGVAGAGLLARRS